MAPKRKRASPVLEAERIVGKRVRGGAKEYLVKWQGCADAHNSWKLAEHVLDPELVAEFEARAAASDDARTDGDDGTVWPLSLARAERELAATLDRLIAALPADLRQPFAWRAAGLVATAEADARPPAVVAPRGAAAEELIEAIRQRLRTLVGPRAVAPDETFHFPAHLPDYAGYSAETVEHVDAFLYDEGELDELVDDGKLSRHYCGPNGPRDIRPLHLVSHSFSLPQLRLLFSKGALGDARGQTIVDVGSRLGAVLWAGAAYSSAARLVGVELSAHFARVQSRVVDSFRLGGRVQVVHADICDCAELLATADVVVLNNVFEFFHDRCAQAAIWARMRAMLGRRGTRLVTVPALSTSLANAGLDIVLDGWVRELPIAPPYPRQPSLEEATVAGSALHSEALAEQNEIFDQIHLYEVV